MNHGVQNSTFTFCEVIGVVYVIINEFPSKAYAYNQIAIIAVNGVFIILTILLNVVSVITIKRSTQLKSKLCYYLIQVQSVVDLGVGIFSMPLNIYYLASSFLANQSCIMSILAVQTTFLPCGLSIITLSGMAMERYIGVLHPFSYQTQVTKKRILTYVCGGGIVVAVVVILSFYTDKIIPIFSSVIKVFYLVFTGYVYTRIYLVVRRLARSEKRSVETANEENQNRRKKILQEIRHAKSCFIVVVCFAIFLLPSVIFPFDYATIDHDIYFKWTITLIMLNSSINSVIFFWIKKSLRKEATKFLKSILS